jgi:uncharacterized protein YbgA (DUF1722 family)
VSGSAVNVSDEHAQLQRRVDAALDALFAGDWTLADLVSLQARLKLALMACAPAAQKELGRLVAGGKQSAPAALAAAYRRGVSLALADEPARGRHVNALDHAAGYFRDRADDAERLHLHDCIADYGRGERPLRSVLDEFRGCAGRHQLTYLEGQIYFA